MTSGGEILHRLLSSEAKADLVVLFHKNPGLIDNIEGVALRIGRSAATIGGDVADLVDLGVLRRRRLGNSEVISLDSTRDREVQAAIASHLQSLKMEEGE